MTNNCVTAVTRAAYGEMEFTVAEGQFEQKFDTSIPCQLRFTGEPSQNVERFHESLDDSGFTPLAADPARGPNPTDDREIPFYRGEVATTDEYKRIKVRVNRQQVRIYPYDPEPSLRELSRLVATLETGFGAELIHDPLRNPLEEQT